MPLVLGAIQIEAGGASPIGAAYLYNNQQVLFYTDVGLPIKLSA